MTTLFKPSPDVYSASDKDGATILNIERGMLYSVVGLGRIVWDLLATHPEGLTLEDVLSSLSEGHSTKSQVERLLTDFIQKRIVQRGDHIDARGTAVHRWIETPCQHLNLMIVTFLTRRRLIVLTALFQLIVIDLILKFGGFHSLHSLVKRWPVQNQQYALELSEVCDKVEQAMRLYVKRVLCLQKSAVFTCLLRTHGVPAEMVIACRRMPFKGHAWVEIEHRVVNDTQRIQIVCNSVLTRF